MRTPALLLSLSLLLTVGCAKKSSPPPVSITTEVEPVVTSDSEGEEAAKTPAPPPPPPEEVGEALDKETLERAPEGRSYQSAVAAGGDTRSNDAPEVAQAIEEELDSDDAYDMEPEAAPMDYAESTSSIALGTKRPSIRKRDRGASSPSTPSAKPSPAGAATTSGAIGDLGSTLGGVVGGNVGGGAVSEDESVAYGPTHGWTDLPPETVATREAYEDYGINAMTQVSSDAHSTFSIDVDTASYTIARRKLNSGVLPPTASVRVEEFVNYFDYDYVGPAADAPFAVNMEGAPHPFQQSHHLLRFGVQGRELSVSERKPMHLTFLVDTSGSMDSSDKMGLVKQSLRYLVDNLQSGDTVALATYAGSVREVIGPTDAGQIGVIRDAIEDLNAGGSTAMSSGVDLAYEMASASFVTGHENRVVVLSDGDANVGATSHEQLLAQITGYAKQGITLSTIGFGMGNYQDTLMEQLANDGDGNYFYIDAFDEAQKVFGDDLAGTLQVIAKDVKIQVEFNPDAVIAYRLIGYENRDIADKDFRNDAVDAGEIGAGHRVTALYDVVLRDGYRDHDVAVVRLRNKTPGADSAAVEWETRLPARLVHDEFPDASKNLRLAFGAASFAELLRGSPHTAEITYNDLLSFLGADRRDNDLDRELVDLIATAGRLSGESITVAER